MLYERSSWWMERHFGGKQTENSMIATTAPVFKTRLSARGRAAALSVTLLLAALATPATAETAAERAACRPDVYRLCAGEIPSRPRIVACLARKRSQLSPACAEVFRPGGGGSGSGR
jgi:hypothetical protein